MRFEEMKMVTNSKGEIYTSCSFINEIKSLCDEQVKIINDIKEQLETVRKINASLRENQKDEIEIQKAIEDGRDETWEEVADIIGSRRNWVEGDLKDLMKEIQNLKEENQNLLKEIEDLKE